MEFAYEDPVHLNGMQMHGYTQGQKPYDRMDVFWIPEWHCFRIDHRPLQKEPYSRHFPLTQQVKNFDLVD